MTGIVGLVGFGIMGGAIAAKLAGKGYLLRVYDKDPEAVARARDAGYTVVSGPAEAARQAGVIVISLPRPEHVAEIVVGAEDSLLSAAVEGSVIVDTSTVDPETTQRNSAAAKQCGVGYLDCPVFGRPGACGNWTLPTGGEQAFIEIARPVLETFAAKIIPVGPSGQGNVVKLLNNLMFAAINSITCEVFALSAHLGLPPDLLFDTVADSGAATVSGLFREVGANIVERNFAPVFSIDNMQKDVGLGLAMARQAGMQLPLSETSQRLNELAQGAGLGRADTAAVVKVYEIMLMNEGEKKK